MATALNIIGYVLVAIGGFFTGLNFYLSFLNFPLHRLRGGTAEKFRGESGVPIVGSLLLWIGALCLVNHPVPMWTALAWSILDTGGLHWLIGMMIYIAIASNRMRKS